MDEKQLQMLFNEYAKGKGFKDFSEFKSLMDDEASRKVFFEDSNKELGFKDFNDFNATLGVKKKEPITSSAIPSRLPKISEPINPLQQGANILGGGVLKEVSKGVAQLPKEGTQTTINQRSPKERGWLLNMVSALDKGVYKTLGTTVQGAGTLLQGATSKITGGTGEGFISDALIKLGSSYNQMIDELTPQDESFKGSLSDQVGQALGFVGGLALTGGASSAARGSAALIQQAPKSGALASAVKELVKGTVSPTGVVGGLTMGQAEFDRAKQSGATDEQAFEAFYKNAAVGSVLERIPVMHFLKRFNNATAGGVVNYIKTKGVAGLTGGLEEMTTEMLQQLYANKTAKDIYNENQDLFEGVAGNGTIGFSVGFLLNAMGANAKILRKQGRVNEAKLVENQVKELEEKAKGQASTNSSIATKIAVNGNEEGLQRTQAELDNDLQKGLISEEEYQDKAAVAQKVAEFNAKIPDFVQGVNRAESIQLIEERENLQQELLQKEEQKKGIDVAYHKFIDESNKETQKRIDEINNQLGELSKPEKNIIKPDVKTESLEYGGSKYYITDNDGNQIGSAEVSTVDDKIIIDNLFVDEKNKRKGLATSILDKIIEDFKGRNYEYIDQNDVEFSIPYKIEVGTVVSEEGQAFSNSVRKKIEEFNKSQEKGVLPKEEVIQQPIEQITDENIQPPIEQPELVEAVRVEQEPELPKGTRVVTLSGMEEGERVKAVEERKKKTTLTEKETLHNDLIDLANRVQKSRGNEKTNLQGQIRQKVRELNAKAGEEIYKYDGVSVRAKVKSKTKGERYLKIKGTTRDTSGRAIKEDAVLLFDRSPEFVQKYEELADSPNITALQVDSGNGVSMTAEQIESALQDIADGIPSVQADNLLNALEEGFNRGYFDLRGKDIGQDRVQASVEDFIGVQQEEVGQPMDEDAMVDWLNEIAELPQEEQIEIDNIILEYEQQPQQTYISGKVQSPNAPSKTTSTPSPKPSEEGKRNGSPQKEVNKQPIGEAKAENVGEIKKAISELFKSNPEFSKIGTEEEYFNYIQQFFPDSTVKDILYHGSPSKFEKFDKSKKGSNTKNKSDLFYFTKYKSRILDKTKPFSGNVYSVILNITKPRFLSFEKDGYESATYKKVGTEDGVILKSNTDPINTEEVGVFEPEQIHILGSKEDIDGFKDFVKNKKVEQKQPIGETKPKQEDVEPKSPLEQQYEEASQKKGEKAQQKAKEKLISDNFDGIVAQLMTKNKIKRKC